MKAKSNPADQSQRLDVYERVTASIVASLEEGVRPWTKPWSAGAGAPLVPVRANGEPYRGINVLLLWGAAQDGGFVSNRWMTYKQAEAAGAQVRKGEHGSLVVYADRYVKTEQDAAGEECERAIAFMKGYTVFNVEQIDGLADDLYARPALPDAQQAPQLIAAAEAFMAATGAEIRHGGNRAFYAPGPDHIQMPPLQAFNDGAAYTATKAHELVHWSGHESRLARTFGKRFGDHAYAVEELVAELGAAFLCADLGIALEPRPDHASYLANWLQVLKADKRAILSCQPGAEGRRLLARTAGLDANASPNPATLRHA